MKRVLSILLAVILIMSCAGVAFASSSSPDYGSNRIDENGYLKPGYYGGEYWYCVKTDKVFGKHLLRCPHCGEHAYTCVGEYAPEDQPGDGITTYEFIAFKDADLVKIEYSMFCNCHYGGWDNSDDLSYYLDEPGSGSSSFWTKRQAEYMTCPDSGLPINPDTNISYVIYWDFLEQDDYVTLSHTVPLSLKVVRESWDGLEEIRENYKQEQFALGSKQLTDAEMREDGSPLPKISSPQHKNALEIDGYYSANVHIAVENLKANEHLVVTDGVNLMETVAGVSDVEFRTEKISKDTTIKITVLNDKNEVIRFSPDKEYEELTIKVKNANFFTLIISFFRELFGKNTKVFL